MTRRHKHSRRTVLRTIGAGVVAGSVMTGSATASGECDDDAIDMTGETGKPVFDPEDACATLEGGSVDVTWHNSHELPYAHNVHLHHEDMQGEYVSPAIGPEYEWTVTFKDQNGDLLLTNDRSGTRKIVGFNGEVELHMHCDLHDIDGLDPTYSMEGTLTIKRPNDD